MDFRSRLQKAIERGYRARDTKAREDAVRAMSEEDFKRLHSKYRLTISEYVESCLAELADNFPGFRFNTVVTDRGWGAEVSRDDIGIGEGVKRHNLYSRLEMVVSPLGKYHVIELLAKGTIRNKEVYNRNNYQLLDEVDLDSFNELVDLWVLEYAELFSSSS